MKKKLCLFATIVLFAAFVLPCLHAGAQSVTFKPNAAVGEDVDLVTTYGCTPSTISVPAEFLNWDNFDLTYCAWTINALGCSNTSSQVAIRFSELNNLPCNAVITKAELHLFGLPTSGFVPQGNSYYPGSPFPTNPGWVERITSGWSEGSVTWSTMPSTTPVNMTAIPSSTSQWNDNFNIDVTALTQDIWTSGSNDGYMLRLQTNSPYRSLVFASSDDPNSRLWPELYIEYSIPYCNANFTYCSSTPNPNTYDFNAMDPGQCLNYQWNFGDGTTATGPFATHTYTSPGSYVICLSLVDNTGAVQCVQCTQICITSTAPAPAPAPSARPAHTDDKAGAPKKLVSHSGSPSAQPVARGTNFSFADGTITITGVSPNPAHTNMDVNFTLVKAGNVQYKIYNLEGKEMLSEKKAANAGAQKISIPVERFAPGMYVLEMKDDYMQAKYKFTKE